MRATLEDGTVAYGDVLVGADGVWSSVRKILHGLDDGAQFAAASGAAGGALDDAEARAVARETVRVAAKAARRYSGFTCYAALADHKASNIEEVSYQILLGDKKYFVSTDGGGDRQQWFALIREPAGGVDPEPTAQNPTPKLDRLRREFADGNAYESGADVVRARRRERCGANPRVEISCRDESAGLKGIPPGTDVARERGRRRRRSGEGTRPTPTARRGTRSRSSSSTRRPRPTSSAATSTTGRPSSTPSTRSASGRPGRPAARASAATPRTP